MEREAGCEGREEDPKVEVHRVTRSPLFLFVCLFAKKRDHVLNVPGVEAVERWDVPEKGEGRLQSQWGPWPCAGSGGKAGG